MKILSDFLESRKANIHVHVVQMEGVGGGVLWAPS